MERTEQQYRAAIGKCRDLFLRKAQDYGTSWTVLRLPSVTDQLYIKAKRIRTLEETGENRVGESIESEYIGLVNYSVIALILLERQASGRDPFEPPALPAEVLAAQYDAAVQQAWDTLLRKNHDYGEAWREMRMASYTDLILMKLLRIQQIEANEGRTQVSEGVASGYIDILNYAAFALIRMEE
jgi:hypothetical protein